MNSISVPSSKLLFHQMKSVGFSVFFPWFARFSFCILFGFPAVALVHLIIVVYNYSITIRTWLWTIGAECVLSTWYLNDSQKLDRNQQNNQFG